ncbi:MAG TPA: hypothetical protein DEA90_07630, partial [Opitutae bacterium]|nr:hypothetical protein [Opitutae bacterium]
RVPWYYVEPEAHNRLKNVLRDEANAAYAQALAYRMTDDPRFAHTAIRLINSWSTQLQSMSTEEDSTLAFSNLFPAFLFAADLLRGDALWADAEQTAFRKFVREQAIPMNCMHKENNWGNWGMLLVAASAAYLGDEELLQQCASRWKFFIDTQIAEDGHLPHEVDRNEGRHGIWYSHFALLPQTLTGEILRVNGIDVFDYTSPEGRCLRDACECLIPWIERPETFHYWKQDPADLVRVDYYSYFEILHAQWPDFPADKLLGQARPMSAEHSAPFLTFTHGVDL